MELNMSTDTDDLQVEIDETQEDEAHISYDIASYPSDFTLAGLVEMWNNKDITIPDFQREFVWTIKQSSLLIESFLLGLPVPPVFFYIDDDNTNLVVDGQQRLLSIVFFFEGFFGNENNQGKRQVFRLEGLDIMSPYYKKTISELTVADQRKLRNTVLRAINIRQLSPAGNTSIYHIFERLNTGGTPLKPQEIRNVVFRGEIVHLLRELNKDKNWRLILGKPDINRYQTDVELILRILAFMNGASKYEKPMKEFLNKTMRKNQNCDTDDIKLFRDLFPKVTEMIVEDLGEKPFHIRGPLSTSALDSVMGVILQNYDHIPNDLGDRYGRLIEHNKFIEYTTLATTDASIVKDRFKLVRKILID
jgi:hypothetical protein